MKKALAKWEPSTHGDPSQILARMLSRLDNTQATNADASANAAGNTTSTNFAAPEPDASTALTGTDQSRLSDQILALLVQLQQQTTADASQTTNANNSSAPSSGSTISQPVHALFSAMDSNGDGIVTEAEMENYIQQQGGTQSQADKLFATLTQNSSSGISEDQLASDVAQGQKAHHHHHHHEPADASPSSSGNTSSTGLASQASQASQIFAGLDSNKDGTLSAAELTSAGFGTTDPTLSAASGGASSSNAPNSLASLDSNGDGSVSANEFASLFASLELQIQSDTATMANLMQQASQAYGSAAGGSSPPSVVQSA
jgi:Ca2+-binding EF-hand superfamily protein